MFKTAEQPDVRGRLSPVDQSEDTPTPTWRSLRFFTACNLRRVFLGHHSRSGRVRSRFPYRCTWQTPCSSAEDRRSVGERLVGERLVGERLNEEADSYRFGCGDWSRTRVRACSDEWRRDVREWHVRQWHLRNGHLRRQHVWKRHCRAVHLARYAQHRAFEYPWYARAGIVQRWFVDESVGRALHQQGRLRAGRRQVAGCSEEVRDGRVAEPWRSGV